MLATKAPKILEKYGSCATDLEYPHVSKYLCDFWGSTFFHEYVDQILTHQRPQRQGFPLRVVREIHIAIEAHNDQYPFLKPSDKFNWY
jgi:hypothetical protein